MPVELGILTQQRTSTALKWSNVEQPGLWKTTAVAQLLLHPWSMGLVGQPYLTEESIAPLFILQSLQQAVTDIALSSYSTISLNTSADVSCFLTLSSHTDRCFQICIFPQDSYCMERLIFQPETKANCRCFSQWAPFSIMFCHDKPAVMGSFTAHRCYQTKGLGLGLNMT